MLKTHYRFKAQEKYDLEELIGATHKKTGGPFHDVQYITSYLPFPRSRSLFERVYG